MKRRDMTSDLDNHERLKGIVASLRIYLSMIPEDDRSRHTDHIESVAYGEDNATQAMIAVMGPEQ